MKRLFSIIILIVSQLTLQLIMASSIVRKIVSTVNAPAAIGPYNQAVLAGNTLYISGQLGLVPGKGDLIEGGIQCEAEQSLKNIGEILKSIGASYNNVVKTTILLSDLNDFPVVNEIYTQFFKSHYPARATYQVAGLPKNGKIEIEAVAIIGEVKDA